MEQLNLQQTTYQLFASGREYFTTCYAPEVRREEPEKPICTKYERCKGCPYTSHGFVCRHDEDHCLRAEMEKIAEKEKKRRNERNNQQ